MGVSGRENPRDRRLRPRDMPSGNDAAGSRRSASISPCEEGARPISGAALGVESFNTDLLLQMSDENQLRGEVTRLLKELHAGNRAAEDALFAVVYDELHRLAVGAMNAERRNHTLQPTALVHEVYVRVLGGQVSEFQNRTHFVRVAARAMRRVLVDHARKRLAARRGGNPIQVEIDDIPIAADAHIDDILALEQALSRLEKLDPQQGKVVELRYFAGLTEQETAVALGVSARTVQREYKTAKAWLYGEMTRR
jgi:RNA polymerase sigma-70 factor, ECF subfamily